jgi:hypothetical protein
MIKKRNTHVYILKVCIFNVNDFANFANENVFTVVKCKVEIIIRLRKCMNVNS